MANDYAVLPSGEKIPVTIVNGKTQTPLQPGSTVYSGGGSWTVTGGTPGNYTSNPGGTIPNPGYPKPETVTMPSPIIGGGPEITNKVDPAEDSSEQYIRDLACKDVPKANPNLIQDDTDFDEEIL